jgi:hypothetical protein
MRQNVFPLPGGAIKMSGSSALEKIASRCDAFIPCGTEALSATATTLPRSSESEKTACTSDEGLEMSDEEADKLEEEPREQLRDGTTCSRFLGFGLPHSKSADKILYALIARGQTSLVDYSVREGNHVLLAQQILAKAKQDTVSD